MASLKGNIILNYINTLSGLIFPIVTFPYAARVLQPEGIGVVNFQNSIIGYIVLFTSLGIPLYAVREIAKCRNDIELRDRTTVEITLLSIILSLLGYVVVWLLGEYVPRIHEEATLFYILSLTIIFTGIGVQWFYQGVEDFLFITVRGLIFRLLFAICLFVFVKDKGDLLIYGIVIVGSTVGNYLINFIHLRKYIHLVSIKWKQLNITRHIQPALRVFLLNVVISIYIRLNIIMLGFMTDDRAVGLFTSGMKITHILTVIITSLGTVMLPRCSHLIGENKIDEFNAVMSKTYHLLMFSAIPITVGIILLARPITLCFCGADYHEAIPVVIYTAPTIIFIGLTNIIGIQILYPYGKENLVIISTLVAAVLNVILNILLIPPFAEMGAAVSTLLSEFAVLLVQLRLGKGYIPFRFFDKQVAIYLTASLLMAIGVLSCLLIENIWWQMLIGSAVGAILYLTFLYIRKDQTFQEILGFALKFRK
jgi:O-antigen/teichoic acid export membrane protein